MWVSRSGSQNKRNNSRKKSSGLNKTLNHLKPVNTLEENKAVENHISFSQSEFDYNYDYTHLQPSANSQKLDNLDPWSQPFCFKDDHDTGKVGKSKTDEKIENNRFSRIMANDLNKTYYLRKRRNDLKIHYEIPLLQSNELGVMYAPYNMKPDELIERNKILDKLGKIYKIKKRRRPLSHTINTSVRSDAVNFMDKSNVLKYNDQGYNDYYQKRAASANTTIKPKYPINQRNVNLLQGQIKKEEVKPLEKFGLDELLIRHIDRQNLRWKGNSDERISSGNTKNVSDRNVTKYCKNPFFRGALKRCIVENTERARQDLDDQYPQEMV